MYTLPTQPATVSHTCTNTDTCMCPICNMPPAAYTLVNSTRPPYTLGELLGANGPDGHANLIAWATAGNKNAPLPELANRQTLAAAKAAGLTAAFKAGTLIYMDWDGPTLCMVVQCLQGGDLFALQRWHNGRLCADFDSQMLYSVSYWEMLA